MRFWRGNKFVFVFYGLAILLFCIASDCAAFSELQVNVEVIKADKSGSVDPQLKELVEDLTPVLNYSGFTLLKKTVIGLDLKEKRKMILSSDRLLELQLLGFEDNRARLLVKIVEGGQETFRTILLLVDKGSVLIGGPPHEGGVLLLRIGGEFKDGKGS
jgi:hypothetical protein